MLRLLAAASLLVLVASPTLAADTAKADLAAIKSCIAKAGDDPKSCIGHISDPCQEKDDGSSTQGVDACLGQEQTAWDKLLNEAYGRATADAKEKDGGYQEAGLEPAAAASLVKAQRAWIAFRDAECDRRYDLYLDGTIRTNIASSCLLDLTAARAIELMAEQ